MDLAVLRDDMVEGLEHPSKAAVSSESVGLAMRTVPRHEFVDAAAEAAYLDQTFEHRGSTVLAPGMAARLVEALAPEPGDSALVVGAGVGYTVALVAEIAGQENVHALDMDRGTVLDARRNLANAGYEGVLVDCRDGARGLPEYAPYDRILVEAAAMNPPAALVDQLEPSGRLVLPLGGADQSLVAVEDGAVAERFGPVGFHPLLVEGEQHGAVERNRTAREDREFAQRVRSRRRGWEQEWIDWDSYG